MDAGVGMPMLTAKEKPPINVVGDVGGRIAIMVDDMVDDVRSFVAAAEVLKDRGAYKIYVMATHGLLSSDAPRLIEDSPIDEVPLRFSFSFQLQSISGFFHSFDLSSVQVVVTNTIPHEIQKMQCHKIKTVDISVLLAEAIRRIHNKESMSYLFRNVTLEDWGARPSGRRRAEDGKIRHSWNFAKGNKEKGKYLPKYVGSKRWFSLMSKTKKYFETANQESRPFIWNPHLVTIAVKIEPYI